MDDKRKRSNLRRRRKFNPSWLCNHTHRIVASAKNYGPLVSIESKLGPFNGKRPDPLSNVEDGNDEESS